MYIYRDDKANTNTSGFRFSKQKNYGNQITYSSFSCHFLYLSKLLLILFQQVHKKTEGNQPMCKRLSIGLGFIHSVSGPYNHPCKWLNWAKIVHLEEPCSKSISMQDRHLKWILKWNISSLTDFMQWHRVTSNSVVVFIKVSKCLSICLGNRWLLLALL